MTAASLLRWLTYLDLAGCIATWAYAAYHAYHFETEIWAAYRRGRIAASLDPSAAVFAADLPAECRPPRRKVFRALSAFAALALGLLVILYLRWP